jgi:vacuolar iron transporter family protein
MFGVEWQQFITSLVLQISFAGGAAIPTLALLTPDPILRFWAMVIAVTAGLIFFGGFGAFLGGFSMITGGTRVLLGGWLAMVVTYGVGRLIGTDAT